MVSLRQQKHEAELENTRITQAKADMRWNSISEKKDPLSMHEVLLFIVLSFISILKRRRWNALPSHLDLFPNSVSLQFSAHIFKQLSPQLSSRKLITSSKYALHQLTAQRGWSKVEEHHLMLRIPWEQQRVSLLLINLQIHSLLLPIKVSFFLFSVCLLALSLLFTRSPPSNLSYISYRILRPYILSGILTLYFIYYIFIKPYLLVSLWHIMLDKGKNQFSCQKDNRSIHQKTLTASVCCFF